MSELENYEEIKIDGIEIEHDKENGCLELSEWDEMVSFTSEKSIEELYEFLKRRLGK